MGTVETRARLEGALEHAARVLPAQGPIGVFVHHNTLHAFEDRPFERAVIEAHELFAAEPFVAEAEYRAAFARGRVLESDLDAVLENELGPDEPSAAGISRRELWKWMMLAASDEPLAAAREFRRDEGGWFGELAAAIAPERLRGLVERTRAWATRALERSEGSTLGRCLAGSDDPKAAERALTDHLGSRPRAVRHALATMEPALALRFLLGACELRIGRSREPRRRPLVRLRDALLAATGMDVDAFVHHMLIHLCAAFLDQGVAYWAMPNREHGLYVATRELLCQPAPPPNPWVHGVVESMGRQRRRGDTALDVVLEMLSELELPIDEWEPYLRATLLALPGWAGMVRHFEKRPDRAPSHAPPASLLDFVAVRLVLEREASRFIAARCGLPAASPGELLRALRERAIPPRAAQQSLGHEAFAALAHAGVAAPDLLALDAAAASRFAEQIDEIVPLERRRVWQLCYELRHTHQILDPLAVHLAARAEARPRRPRFQAIFCIDERFESVRRHLEEVQPDVETFGTAGFFGVAMYYRGVDDAHAMPLCPIAIRPEHEVHERPLPEATSRLARRRARRRLAGRLAYNAQIGSRTLLRGTVWSALLGILSAIPLVLRVLFPRTAARIGRGVGEIGLTHVETRLDLERTDDERTPEGRKLGFSVEEMADVVGSVLEEIGLTRDFAPIVLVAGHGSSSLNNPHESAHDCGACGGGRGGPNARAFAQMANHPGVRHRLAARGIEVPPGTMFVGAYYDTCNDAITYDDLRGASGALAPELAVLRADLDRARARDAHERARRFETAGPRLGPAGALRHVEARAEDLAQPRPEYGHATNAVAFVGRRSRVRGLFFDRRVYLCSYDPDQDTDGERLRRVLASAVPVGAGINLEYYFSYVDPVRFGASTKLPHNIVGLVGVMDGYASDLRTGLPWQMVEIHEPVRLLTIVEAKPDKLLAAAAALPAVANLAKNGWLRLFALDPDSARMFAFDRGEFVPYEPAPCELPTAARSVDWYGGHREHLPVARIAEAT